MTLANHVVYLISLMNPASCNSFICLSISSKHLRGHFSPSLTYEFYRGVYYQLVIEEVWINIWHVDRLP